METTQVDSPVQKYSLGHSPQELERLQKQSRFLEGFTRRGLQEAGIQAGMKVLEVGCGAGDVSLILAEMVGPSGQVVAVDLNPQALETAQARAAAAGCTNLIFKQADINQDMELDRDFEAVTGRLIFFHLKDPAATLRHLLTYLLPGGLVVFQDYDLTRSTAYPTSTLFEQTIGRITTAFRQAGADPQMGLKLPAIFRQAGLPHSEMRCEASLSAEIDWPGYDQLAMVTRSLLPLIQKFGLASAAEVDIDTLAARLRTEIASTGGVGRGPDLVTAWTRNSR